MFALRERIDSLLTAIRHKNLEQVMWHYAPDVVAYQLAPPLDVHGVAAYRKTFERWFQAMAGRIHYEAIDLRVTAGDAQAFCHFLAHVAGARTGGGRVDYWVRVTNAWRKIDGQWLVTHEHVSMPTML